MSGAIALAVIAAMVLGFTAGWHARTWPAPDDTDLRLEHAAGLDALDRIHHRLHAPALRGGPAVARPAGPPRRATGTPEPRRRAPVPSTPRTHEGTARA